MSKIEKMDFQDSNIDLQILCNCSDIAPCSLDFILSLIICNAFKASITDESRHVVFYFFVTQLLLFLQNYEETLKRYKGTLNMHSFLGLLPIEIFQR
ncbi:hypothetical protein BH11BAC1_BH11BAC1_14480 [soil metagenome]